MSKSALAFPGGMGQRSLKQGSSIHKFKSATTPYCSPNLKRSFSASFQNSSQLQNDPKGSQISENGNGTNHLARRAREKLYDKEFFFDLLSSAATKRDAKAYLSRLQSPRKVEPLPVNGKNTEAKPHIKAPKHGVNLGSFFGHGRAVEDRPVFKQYKDLELEIEQTETIHVALVKVAVPQELDDGTIEGIAQTLGQLVRLSMVPCVVIDTRPGTDEPYLQKRIVAARQATRLVDAIEKYRGARATRLDSLLTLTEEGACKVSSRKALLRPLRDGRIPVIIPIAYTESTQKAVLVPADDVLLTLTKEMAGLTIDPPVEEDLDETATAIFKALQGQVSIDRIILLDPCGSIAFPGSDGKVHVFINMEQEYDDIVHDLTHHESNEKGSLNTSNGHQVSNSASIHLQNLKLLKSVLSLLPPSSSAIVTTPEEAAKSSRISRQDEQVSAVGTRRQKNPLIHNMLTDKPAQSSSLPPGRLGLLRSDSIPPITSTFVKKGMPLTILPDPRIAPWTADNHGQSRIKLTDPRIDLGRLVYLIEDSFNRKLDVQDYLNRVNHKIAGLIIAGNYEGGALLTWEAPPGVIDDGRPENTKRLVPYLDKFAVLKRSQGAGGVADIVFNAMTRGCFPDGVVWRSRRDNPVNKWYFERARGTWKIPGTNWTMFWTTPGVDLDSQLFRDYEAVCRQIQPSWADNKNILD